MIVRRVALIVALLLLVYVIFGVVWMLTEPLRVVLPAPTRTPRPTYTPIATREVLLIVTPTPSPSSTIAPTATPTTAEQPTPTPSATPTTAEQPTPTPSATPTPRQHVVQAGDTLLGIVQQYQVDYGSLLAANDITDADLLYVGQVLTIPASAPTPAPDERRHVVGAGETLWGISIRYGVVYEALLQANAITDPDRIYEGQALIIPEE